MAMSERDLSRIEVLSQVIDGRSATTADYCSLNVNAKDRL